MHFCTALFSVSCSMSRPEAREPQCSCSHAIMSDTLSHVPAESDALSSVSNRL